MNALYVFPLIWHDRCSKGVLLFVLENRECKLDDGMISAEAADDKWMSV